MCYYCLAGRLRLYVGTQGGRQATYSLGWLRQISERGLKKKKTKKRIQTFSGQVGLVKWADSSVDVRAHQVYPKGDN